MQPYNSTFPIAIIGSEISFRFMQINSKLELIEKTTLHYGGNLTIYRKRDFFG